MEACEFRHDGVLTPIQGSMRSMVPIAGYFLNRAPDPQSRAELLAGFRRVFRDQVVRMLADCTDLMDGLAPARAHANKQQVAG